MQSPGQCPVTTTRTQDSSRASAGETGQGPTLPLLTWLRGGGWSLEGSSESSPTPNGLWHFVTPHMSSSHWDLLPNLGSKSIAGVLPNIQH